MEAPTAYAPKRSRAQKWKIAIIVLSCTTVAFFIIFGVLLGVASSNTYSYTTYEAYDGTHYSSTRRPDGAFAEAIAALVFLALACLSALLWIITLILRFTSWYRQPVNNVAPLQQPSQYSRPQPINQNIAPTTAPTSSPGTSHFCSNCEKPTTGSFCSNCGHAVR